MDMCINCINMINIHVLSKLEPQGATWKSDRLNQTQKVYIIRYETKLKPSIFCHLWSWVVVAAGWTI